MKISIIEDSTVAAILIEKVLSKINLDSDIMKFSNGAEFVNWVETDKQRNIPDLIITDINMPRLDGLGVIKYCNSNPFLELTKIIVVSANKNRSIITDCLRLGADNYIIKPFDPDKLIFKLQQYIQKDRSTEDKIKLLVNNIIQDVFEQKYAELKTMNNYYHYKKLEKKILDELQESIEFTNLLKKLSKNNSLN